MAVDLARQRLFVAELGNDSVGVVDLKAMEVSGTIVLGLALISAATAGERTPQVKVLPFIKAEAYSPASSMITASLIMPTELTNSCCSPTARTRGSKNHKASVTCDRPTPST